MTARIGRADLCSYIHQFELILRSKDCEFVRIYSKRKPWTLRRVCEWSKLQLDVVFSMNDTNLLTLTSLSTSCLLLTKWIYTRATLELYKDKECDSVSLCVIQHQFYDRPWVIRHHRCSWIYRSFLSKLSLRAKARINYPISNATFGSFAEKIKRSAQMKKRTLITFIRSSEIAFPSSVFVSSAANQRHTHIRSQKQPLFYSPSRRFEAARLADAIRRLVPKAKTAEVRILLCLLPLPSHSVLRWKEYIITIEG